MRLRFYDALASHETAKEAMGDKELRAIAHELTKTVKETWVLIGLNAIAQKLKCA